MSNDKWREYMHLFVRNSILNSIKWSNSQHKISTLEHQTVIINEFLSFFPLFIDVFQYVSSPQEVKPAPVEQKVETQNVKAEHVEPQPVEHKA